VPAGAASPERIPRPVGGRLQGWVQGAGPEGERFRVESKLPFLRDLYVEWLDQIAR